MALMEDFRKHGDFLFRYRSFLPIPLFIFGFAIHLFIQFQTKGLITPEYFYAICFGVSFFGLIIRTLVIGYAPMHTSGRNTKLQIANVLNRTGMYSIVRHPLYVGNFFMWLGIAMITTNIWFIVTFVLIYWLYYERIMYAEEAFLREKFGEVYLNWANTVPAFIPDIKKWQTPEEFFSFKNVLRREYTGFFKLVLVFFFFHYTHSVIEANYNFAPLGIAEKIWIFAMLFALVMYISIRLLHKKSRVLDVEGR